MPERIGLSIVNGIIHAYAQIIKRSSVSKQLFGLLLR